jgi:hypothetical protein
MGRDASGKNICVADNRQSAKSKLISVVPKKELSLSPLRALARDLESVVPPWSHLVSRARMRTREWPSLLRSGSTPLRHCPAMAGRVAPPSLTLLSPSPTPLRRADDPFFSTTVDPLAVSRNVSGWLSRYRVPPRRRCCRGSRGLRRTPGLSADGVALSADLPEGTVGRRFTGLYQFSFGCSLAMLGASVFSSVRRFFSPSLPSFPL